MQLSLNFFHHDITQGYCSYSTVLGFIMIKLVFKLGIDSVFGKPVPLMSIFRLLLLLLVSIVYCVKDQISLGEWARVASNLALLWPAHD